MKFKKTILLVIMVVLILPLLAQEQIPLEEESCLFDQVMQEYYDDNPEALKESKSFEKKVDEYAKKKKAGQLKAAKYIVPVVFHVYGNDWDGKPNVTDDRVKQALAAINVNFKGFNDVVDPRFSSIESGMDIEFRLAQIDPNGNTTSGIIYHETKTGFGLNGTNDNEIAKYAWDNYKYMNVHIQLIIKTDSKVNSGVAWYPSVSMSNVGTARVVYNGKYIIYSPPASSITHEFGHFLGLMHTFEGGCTNGDGDLVADTPPCTQAQAGANCSNSDVRNCFNQYTNYDNHMDYNPCETMYTKGQVTRMESFMTHDARKTLWTSANLSATGVNNNLGKRVLFNYQQPEDSEVDKYLTLVESEANDGAIANKRKIKAIEGVTFTISSGTLTQGTHYNITNLPSGLTPVVTMLNNTTAQLSFTGKASQHTSAASREITLTLLNAAISGGVSQLYSASGKYKIAFLDSYDKFYEVLSPHVMMGVTTNTNQTAIQTSFSNTNIATTLALNLTNYNGNTICIDNQEYDFNILCDSGTKNVKLISDGGSISASTPGTWVTKTPTATQLPIVTGSSYSTWNGKTAYAAMRIPTILGSYLYGWLKIRVSSDGKMATLIAYGVNEQPNGSLTASVTKPMVMYLNDRFLESNSNNGTVGNQLDVNLYNTTFAKTGTLTAGTHYTIANVPSGLQFSINVTSSTTAKLIMTGTPSDHGWKYYNNINLKFLDAAFASLNASQVTQSSYSLWAEFTGATFKNTLSGLISNTGDATPSSAWFTVITAEQTLTGRSVAYQLQKYTNEEVNGMKFISWRKDAVANSSYQLTPIDANVVIGPNSSWKNGQEYNVGNGQHLIDGPTYTAWRGKTKYIGIRFQRSGKMHYGWIEMAVSSNGGTIEFKSYGVCGKPDTGIQAGTTIESGGGTTDTQAPSAPSGLSSTGQTSSSISLSWNASTDNVGVTGYDIFSSGTLIGSSTGTTYTATGLQSNKSYNFTVKARDAAGNVSAASNTLSVATTGGGTTDTQAPSAPSGLSSTGQTSSSISLSWNASTDNVGVTGYDVYRGSTLAGNTSGTSYTVTGLTASTIYSFTVRAKDAAGNVSTASNSVSATTLTGGGCTNYCASKGTRQQL